MYAYIGTFPGKTYIYCVSTSHNNRSNNIHTGMTRSPRWDGYDLYGKQHHRYYLYLRILFILLVPRTLPFPRKGIKDLEKETLQKKI